MKTLNLFFLLLIALSSCRGGGSTGKDVGSFNDTIYAPLQAKGFALLSDSAKRGTLLRVDNPWQSASDVATYLYLSQGDEPAPEGLDAQVVHGSARRIVAMSSTFVAMLDKLGEADRIVGVSGIDFISSEAVKARRNEIVDVGYEGNVDYEKLMSVNPDLVLLYGVNGASAMEPKLHQLAIPYVYIGDYLEESPTAKAEWLVALGAIVGCRQKAQTIYQAIADRYDALRQSVETSTERPTVMINAPYGDAWFMPSVSSYMVRLIEDAGGRYVYPDNTSDASVSIDMEQAYLLANQSDIWLNPGTATTLTELTSQLPRFSDCSAVKARRVYNNNARLTKGGGNDFYESAVVNPDVVLSDLIKIFHGHADSLTYYRQLK
jgi:iron complex transport system substrate-binding protein